MPQTAGKRRIGFQPVMENGLPGGFGQRQAKEAKRRGAEHAEEDAKGSRSQDRLPASCGQRKPNEPNYDGAEHAEETRGASPLQAALVKTRT